MNNDGFNECHTILYCSVEDIISFGVGGDNASYNVVMEVDNESNIFIIYTVLPTVVPELKRSSVSEYITRANYGTNLGHFDLDFSDGELRFKCGTDVKSSTLSDDMIESMLLKSMYSVDMHFPRLMRLMYANISAADAIRDIDSRQAEGEGGVIL